MPTLDWIGKKAVVKHHKDVAYRLLKLVAELTPPAVMYTVQTNGCFFSPLELDDASIPISKNTQQFR